jgi:uncharacterized protein (TIGR02118 family)
MAAPSANGAEGLRFDASTPATLVRCGTSTPYYLVAELDWDDIDALQRDFRSPEGQATAADVAKLASEGKIRSLIYELEEV